MCPTVSKTPNNESKKSASYSNIVEVSLEPLEEMEELISHLLVLLEKKLFDLSKIGICV